MLKDLWSMIPPMAKQAITKLALGTLSSEHKNARKGAAIAVSAIASIDQPKKLSPEILQVLLTANAITNINAKMSFLEALGYICEELEEGSLDEKEINEILNILVRSITPEIELPELKVMALGALQNCLRFCEKNFKNEGERGIIMTNIISCLNIGNHEIKLKATQCLLEAAKNFYDHIGGPILEHIGLLTIDSIKKIEEEDIALICLEIWSCICDEEIERQEKSSIDAPCKNYIKTASGVLLPLLLETLKNYTKDDENEWSISISSACCLSLMAKILKDVIASPIMEFISANISSPDWKLRNAALLAFTSILNGLEKTQVSILIEKALPTLIALLQDPKPQVQETAAWTFAKIAENASEVFKKVEEFDSVMAHLIPCLKNGPRISNQVCFAIHNLAESLKPQDKDKTCLMSKVYQQVMQALWENAFRVDAFAENVSLAQSSFAALTNVIQYAAPDILIYLNAVFAMLIDTFIKTMHPTFSNPGRAQDYQGLLCGALQPVCIKLGSNLPLEIAGNVINIIIESFAYRKGVYDEGIIALAGVITAVGNMANPFAAKIYPYLGQALQSPDDTILCRAGVGLLGDLARALEDKISPLLPDTIPFLLRKLQNEETERNLKVSIISVLGDLASATGKAFGPYLSDVLAMLKSASTLSTELQVDDDPDSLPYIKALKESILESYTGIIITVKELQTTSILDPYVGDLFQYLNILSGTEHADTLDFVKLLVGLVGDLANLYGKKIQPLLIAPFVMKIIDLLKKSAVKEYRQLATWAQKSVSIALKP